MTSNNTGAGSNPEKPTDQWVTGDEPMTGPQSSYLATLAREAGRDVPDGLTKAQASELIDELQQVTGRGADQASDATTDQASGQADGETAGDRGGDPGGGTLGERVERAGVVDQQAILVDDLEQQRDE